MIRNDPNPDYRTPGGNSTGDRVFCLSIAWTQNYSDNSERQCLPSAYAVTEVFFADDDDDSSGCCFWWLRSPGRNSRFAAGVHFGGFIVRRNKELWPDAGAIDLPGKVRIPKTPQ